MEGSRKGGERGVACLTPFRFGWAQNRGKR